MAYDVQKLTRLKHLRDLAERIKFKVDELEDRMDNVADTIGDTVISSIKVNGSEQTVVDGSVDITIPTKVSELDNDSKYQTEDEVNDAIKAQLASTYRPGGSVDPDNLPELTEENIGVVVNVTDPFVTDDDFVGGAGTEYPAGTNVVIIQTDDGIKYDVMSSFVDLSNYVQKDELDKLITLPVASNNTLGGIKVDYVEAEDAEADSNKVRASVYMKEGSDILRVAIARANGSNPGLVYAGDGIIIENGKISVNIATDAEVVEMLDNIFPQDSSSDDFIDDSVETP